MAKWWRSMRCGSITGRRTAAKHRSGAEAAAGRRDSSPPTPELSTGKTNPQAPGWNKRAVEKLPYVNRDAKILVKKNGHK
uniref:Uncharacterized protein n=1 Tax=Aegilops tauschii subsp. strangulata TaxID=200361 RepID=A0A453HGF6_AEGTS